MYGLAKFGTRCIYVYNTHTYLSKDLFGVEKAVSAEVAVLLVEVDVLEEVTEKVRQTKSNSGLVGEGVLYIVADVTRKVQIRFLAINITVLNEQVFTSSSHLLQFSFVAISFTDVET